MDSGSSDSGVQVGTKLKINPCFKGLSDKGLLKRHEDRSYIKTFFCNKCDHK